MFRRMSVRFFVFSTCLLLFAIFPIYSQDNTLEQPEQKPDESKLPPYSRFLNGIKICLDPGHGGQGHIPDYKRGPTGLREAEINLKVAKYLKTLLEQAGTTVILTRIDDTYVSLARRSEIANENEVDFFISLHHNGIDNNPEVNFTSTWYHGDADESRTSLDLARYIQKGVSDALSLPKSTPAGLFSDKLIVSSGFGVLRLTKCPAIVCEASFYTNPEEEARLKNEEYLKKQAYGYFLGIARYVEAGFPKGVLITPKHETKIQTKTPTIKIQVNDGLHERGAWMLKRQQVFTDTIKVKINGVNSPFEYDRETDIITVNIKEPLPNGINTVQTEMVNLYGNHSLPKSEHFIVAPPADELQLNVWTDTMPYNGKGYVGIGVTALDADRQPIANGEIITVKTSKGTISDTEVVTLDGKSHFYLNAPNTPGTALIEATYGDTRNTHYIYFTDIGNGILQGQVIDAETNEPISAAILQAEPNLITISDSMGHYLTKTDPAAEHPYETAVHLSKKGFYPATKHILIKANNANILNLKLHAIADGVFENFVIILDSQTHSPRINQLIGNLNDMLELAGATVYNIHSPEQQMSTEERIKLVNNINAEGYYLQINHSSAVEGVSSVIAKHNRGNRDTEMLLKEILKQYNYTFIKTPIVTVQDRDTPIIQQTNKLAMTFEIRSLEKTDTVPEQEATAIFIGAWLFLKEETEIEKEKIERFMVYYNRIRGE